MNRSQQPALTLFAVGLFAVGMIGLGILALIYGDFAMVWQPVAPWIPGRTVLAYGSGVIMLLGGVGRAYLTGAGQIACGLGVLFSVFPRVAARVEAGMLSVFTLLVWVPAILAAPRARLPWTAFFISWAIASAAWVVAQNVAPGRP